MLATSLGGCLPFLPLMTEQKNQAATRRLLAFISNFVGKRTLPMQVMLRTLGSLALILSFVDAARLVFSTSASLTADHINYSTDETQRCYSMSCFDNKAALVSWEDVDSDRRLVFYDGADCTGSYVKGDDNASWALEFATVGFKAKTSSFMIWQYSVYPVNGLVDLCEESAIVGINANASST